MRWLQLRTRPGGPNGPRVASEATERLPGPLSLPLTVHWGSRRLPSHSPEARPKFICLYLIRSDGQFRLGSWRPQRPQTFTTEYGTVITTLTAPPPAPTIVLAEAPSQALGEGSRPCGYGEFNPEIMRLELAISTGLGPAVSTLLFMLAWVNRDGWTHISKVRIARGLDIAERTVQRHWERARKAGYLRSFDYPAEARRTSDHWLIWPGLKISSGDPGLDALAEMFPASPDKPRVASFTCSPGYPPF